MPTELERLQDRAARLEASLAATLRSFDEDALHRFAERAYFAGVEQEALDEIFDRMVGRPLVEAYTAFGRDTAEARDLPVPVRVLPEEALSARTLLVQGLSDEAARVIEGLVQQARAEGWGVDPLARRIKEQIGLTAHQNHWVSRYRHKLRTRPAEALKNALRDRRSDARLARLALAGERLPEEYVRRLTDRYREKWLVHRSRLIARTELIRASNASTWAAFLEAEEAGALPDGARKFWRHVGDAKVRHSHWRVPGMNPDGVALNGAFKTPLGPLRYPLDPLGTAENTVGCRCMMLVDTRAPDA